MKWPLVSRAKYEDLERRAREDSDTLKLKRKPQIQDPVRLVTPDIPPLKPKDRYKIEFRFSDTKHDIIAGDTGTVIAKKEAMLWSMWWEGSPGRLLVKHKDGTDYSVSPEQVREIPKKQPPKKKQLRK